MIGSEIDPINYCCPKKNSNLEECTICGDYCGDYVPLPPGTEICEITYPFYHIDLDGSRYCCKCEDQTECQLQGPLGGANHSNEEGVYAMMQENGTVDDSKF